MKFVVVIPARYAASRLPGKVLCDLGGKPIVQHVYETAVASGAERVAIATDDERVAAAARDFDAEIVMTSSAHETGTDRLAEALRIMAVTDVSIVVNLQGDEPLMPPALIRQVVMLLQDDAEASMATLCEPIDDQARIFDPDLVKVVFDEKGRAQYFSRAPIPWDRETFAQPTQRQGAALTNHYGHLGLYAYRAGYVQTFTSLQPCVVERLERLEQLRALHYGACIRVGIATEPAGRGVDTPADLEYVREQYSAHGSAA